MRSAFSMAQLSELIGLIYDAAIDPARWPVAIEAIRIALDFENATFNLQALPSGEVLLNVTSNIPQGYVDRIADYGAEVMDQWGGPAVLLALPMDQPVVLSQVNPDALNYDTTTNRYTLEWAKPQALVDVMALGLARDERGLGSLAFGRHESAEPIGAREIEAARLLIPHLQRAATINRLLDMAAIARSTFETVLDTLTAPVFLTTADLHVVHANPAAHAIVAGGELLNIRNGILNPSVSAVSSALARGDDTGRRRTRVRSTAKGWGSDTLARRFGRSLARAAAAPGARVVRCQRGRSGVCRTRGHAVRRADRAGRGIVRPDAGRGTCLRADRSGTHGGGDVRCSRHRPQHGQDASAAAVREDRRAAAGRAGSACRVARVARGWYGLAPGKPGKTSKPGKKRARRARIHFSLAIQSASQLARSRWQAMPF